eukprot:3448162-Amphidinium_carterae.1
MLAQRVIPANPLTLALTTLSWESPTWQEVEPMQEDCDRWKACLRDLRSLVYESFAGQVLVEPFGSMVSGFCTGL